MATPKNRRHFRTTTKQSLRIDFIPITLIKDQTSNSTVATLRKIGANSKTNINNQTASSSVTSGRRSAPLPPRHNLADDHRDTGHGPARVSAGERDVGVGEIRPDSVLFNNQYRPGRAGVAQYFTSGKLMRKNRRPGRGGRARRGRCAHVLLAGKVGR